jgi:hypothetical protein
MDQSGNGRIPVPSESATQLELVEFALTFNGYTRNSGGSSKIAPMANKIQTEFKKSHTFPDDLDQLRTALFWEQRSLRNNEEFSRNAWTNAEPYWRALVSKIRDLTGGIILENADEAP